MRKGDRTGIKGRLPKALEAKEKRKKSSWIEKGERLATKGKGKQGRKTRKKSVKIR